MSEPLGASITAGAKSEQVKQCVPSAMFPMRVRLTHAPPDRAPRLPRRYLENTVVPTLTQGLTQMCIQEPEDPICWLAQVACGLCRMPS